MARSSALARVLVQRRSVVGFYWFDDAVDVARSIAEQTGVRQRVYKGGGSNSWKVAPSSPRLVEVTC